MAMDDQWGRRSAKAKGRYMQGLAALYTDATPPEHIADAGKNGPPRKRNHEEENEQIVICNSLMKMNVLFYHIPNGGRRNHFEAIRLKRMGVKAGIPDICIPLARGGYHGAYGEVKRRVGGVVSDNQKWWLNELKEQGYYVFVAHGADDFIKHVQIYLKLEKGALHVEQG